MDLAQALSQITANKSNIVADLWERFRFSDFQTNLNIKSFSMSLSGELGSIGDKRVDDIVGNLVQGLEPTLNKTKQIADSFLQQELGLLNAILDGRALNHHIEDSYYEAFWKLLNDTETDNGGEGRAAAES